MGFRFRCLTFCVEGLALMDLISLLRDGSSLEPPIKNSPPFFFFLFAG
jgi:hypothetical protein